MDQTQGISVGDAVLTFVGDTTQLDQAFERVGSEAQVKLAPANAAIEQVGQEWQFAGQTASTAAGEMFAASEEVAEGAELSASAMREARGEAGLLGEATGIHLPRHVRSFLAELPGVGEALSAAFSATAVLFLAEALIKGADKLTEWISNTFIFTEAQKNLNNELVAGNKAVVEYNKDLDDLVKKYQLIGLEGSKRTAMEFSFSVKDSQELEEKLRMIRDEIFAANQGWRTTPELVQVVNQQVSKLHADMKEDELKKLLLPDNATREQVVAAFSSLQAELQGKLKVVQQSQANSEKEFDEQKLKEDQQLAEKQQRLAEQVQKYIDKLHADGVKQMEKEAEEATKLIEFRGEQELKKEMDTAKQEIELDHQKLQSALAVNEGEIRSDEQKFRQQEQQLRAAFQSGLLKGQEYLTSVKLLNEKEVEDLKHALETRQRLVVLNAMNEAAARGKILTEADAHELKAYIDLENKKALVTQAADARIAKATDQVTAKAIKDFGGIDKAIDQYVKKLREAHGELQGFGAGADEVLGDISKSFGSAVDQWITGQKSFGAALEEALAQYLAQVAAKAAIDAIYFTAWGIADIFWNPARAGADFGAAAEFAAIAVGAGIGAKALSGGGGGSKSGGSGAGSSGSSSTSVSSGGSSAPSGVNVNQVQSFATGGIALSPMLAQIADSGEEAVIPLHDRRASHMLAESLAGSLSSSTLGGLGRSQSVNPFDFKALAREMAKAIGAHQTHVKIESDIPYAVKKINHAVRTGRARLEASNSRRLTRQS